MDELNIFFMSLLVVLIVFLLVNHSRKIVNIKHIYKHRDGERPYFDIHVLPLDNKDRHHKKFIPGVPTPKHAIPGVPTPVTRGNLTPHTLN